MHTHKLSTKEAGGGSGVTPSGTSTARAAAEGEQNGGEVMGKKTGHENTRPESIIEASPVRIDCSEEKPDSFHTFARLNYARPPVDLCVSYLFR